MLRLTFISLLAVLMWQAPVYAEKKSMEKSYVVIDLTVKDPEKMKQYGQVAKKSIAKNGGKFIANSEVEALYGKSNYKRKVIIEFPSVESAKAWYNSPEYQKIIPVRNIAMDARFHIIKK